MAMASQRNIVWQTQHRVCFSSPVNMATEDIVVFTHLSRSPAKLQISNWLLPSESKRVDALLFKLNYAHAFKNQGYKNSKLLVTKSHHMTVRFACLDLKKKKRHNNSLAQYLCRTPQNVNTFPFSALS